MQLEPDLIFQLEGILVIWCDVNRIWFDFLTRKKKDQHLLTDAMLIRLQQLIFLLERDERSVNTWTNPLTTLSLNQVKFCKDLIVRKLSVQRMFGSWAWFAKKRRTEKTRMIGLKLVLGLKIDPQGQFFHFPTSTQYFLITHWIREWAGWQTTRRLLGFGSNFVLCLKEWVWKETYVSRQPECDLFGR